MSDPIKALREALGEANNALGWASSMLIEGVEFYTVREVLHSAQKDAGKCHQALTRAEAALTELQAEQNRLYKEAFEKIVPQALRDETPPMPEWDNRIESLSAHLLMLRAWGEEGWLQRSAWKNRALAAAKATTAEEA